MTSARETFEVQPGRVLVVSEDPFFVESVRAVAELVGGTVVACMGPAASPCALDEEAICPLVARSSIVMVDPPPSGAFRYHMTHISAHDYAARIRGAHPHTHVLVRGDTSLP